MNDKIGNCRSCRYKEHDSYIGENVCQAVTLGSEDTYVHEVYATEACLVVSNDFGCVKFEPLTEEKKVSDG